MTNHWNDSFYEQLSKWQHVLNNFPARLTGSVGHQDFINWLKDEIYNMEYDAIIETHYFNYWEPESYELRIDNKPIEVSGYFPYSGLTVQEGITKEAVFYMPDTEQNFQDKIAIFDIYLLQDGKSALFKDAIAHPLLASKKAISLLKKIKELGAAGAVFIWEEMSQKLSRNEVLPFSNPYLDIPAVWISSRSKPQLIHELSKNNLLTLILTGKYKVKSPTESFFVKIEGRKSKPVKESILVTTHTDGPNAIEENGPIALLLILYYLKVNDIQLPETIIFAFISGHFQQEQIGGPRNKATGRWLESFPELWDGEGNHLKAVFSLTLEHLGCLSAYDNKELKFVETETPETNYIYYSDSQQKYMIKRIIEKSKTKDKIMYLDAQLTPYFGEGMPIFKHGIPNVSIISMPQFLFQPTYNYVKPDLDLMYEQIRYSTEILFSFSNFDSNEIP
uniref:hypothetical protein n=1 Tax=Enterococcus faecalis TaxID=1351 RepID=UPI000418410F|nr:hypothetical protein [Enterococcus faecalis]